MGFAFGPNNQPEPLVGYIKAKIVQITNTIRITKLLRRLASRRNNLVIRIVLSICSFFVLMSLANGSGWLFWPNASPIRLVIHIRQKSTSTVWSPSYSHILKNHIPLVHPMKTRPDFQEQGLLHIPLVNPTKTPPDFQSRGLLHIPLVYTTKTPREMDERKHRRTSENKVSSIYHSYIL